MTGLVVEALRLRPDATAGLDGSGRLQLARGSKRFALGPLVPQLADPLRILLDRESVEPELFGALPAGDEAATAQLASVLERLDARGWLERTLRHDGADLVTVKPLVARLEQQTPQAAAADLGTVVLSRFALARRVGRQLVLESPRSSAQVVVHDERVGAFLAALAQPCRPEEVAACVGLPAGVLRAVTGALLDAALVVADASEEEATMSLAQWSLPDLYFHTRSRQGRQAGGYGATWPLQDRFPALPVVGPADEQVVPLPPVDLAAAAATDPSFTAVVERRQSLRLQDNDAPITIDQLAAFLYRSAGVRHGTASFSDGTPRPLGMSRPYPTGGALYELELYPVVNRCTGLGPGLYHYDPLRHQLGLLVDGLDPGLESMLQQTCAKTGMAERTQVLIVLSARFGKVMYKYEAIPYATILKNVGVLYQNMYLVATAMGLAPCAVGGGDSDAFAGAAGLDYYEETSVGEFLVGSSKSTSGIPPVPAKEFVRE